MFEIIKNKTSRPSHSLYLNGKLFSEKLFLDEKEGKIDMDGFPKFDIKEIAKMKATEFPDGLEFQFTSHRYYEHCFDLFTIYRKGNLVTISMYGNFDLDSTEEWLRWHPLRFIEKATEIAEEKGYRSSPDSMIDDDFLIFMDFEVKSTIGELFNKAIIQLHEVLEETDKQMWKACCDR
jgi:hypothetical protein